MFKNTAEYDRAEKFIDKFWLDNCLVCEKLFRTPRARGKRTAFCSNKCRSARSRAMNRNRVRRFRYNQKMLQVDENYKTLPFAVADKIRKASHLHSCVCGKCAGKTRFW